MSDLISRSELKKNILKWLKPTGNPCETEMVKLDDIAISVLMEIEEQPTAYDVEKVVGELEEAKEKIAKEDYCRTKCYDENDCEHKDCFKCCAEYLIDIVKRGGVE